MKNTIKFMIGLLAIGLVSCEPEFENAVTDSTTQEMQISQTM